MNDIDNKKYILEICKNEEYFIDKGGNGRVYKIPGDKYVIKKLMLKFRNGNSLNKFEKKKYNRFRDEIKIVTENQDEIPGILPILSKSELPDKISKDYVIYYVMPYAKCINKVKFDGIRETIKAFLELYRNLILLHERGISHRDIKPNNIYKFDDKYVFSDFGLVHYPEKVELTKDENKIGPWTTIAPEMERAPFDSDPKLADIYSIAKSMWIILTGENKSFEGQYDKLDDSISIDKYLNEIYDEHQYYGVIHDILRRSTSNDPQKRPSIKEIIELLNIWLDNDFEKLSNLEWKYLLNEIIPTKARRIIWEDTEEIGKVLKSVSKTHGLNHTFLPSGGGLDLKGCKTYNNKTDIELDFGYKTVLKPKRLVLNTYKDSQWNNFYLEADLFEVEGFDCSEISNMFFQIDENKYVEPWWENYDKYNGENMPDDSRTVKVCHYGNFVIFPKKSFYNLKLDRIKFCIDKNYYHLDTYGALHHKIGNADLFDKFIKNMLNYINKEKVYDKEFINIIIDNGYKQYQVPIKNDEYNEKLKEKIESYNFKDSIGELLENNNVEPLHYNLFIELNIFNSYILGTDYNLYKYNREFEISNFFDKSKQNKTNKKKSLIITNSCVLGDVLFSIEKTVKEFTNNLLDEIKIKVYAENFRKYRVEKPIFSKKDLKKILINGDDKNQANLVINMQGELELLKINEYNFKKDNISAELFCFDHHENILGKQSGYRLDNFIDNCYLDFLSIFYKHLKYGCKTNSPEDIINSNESEYIEKINKENEKYSSI